MNRTDHRSGNRALRRMSLLKAATSALVLGLTMVGCGMNGQAQRPGHVSDAKAAQVAASAAAAANKALAKKKNVEAITLAETAVAAQPRNADYRMLLGQAYLASGRFQSAEQSFADTLTLDPERERAALNLALAQVALGKKDAARSTLADYRDKLSAADLGLALALAGDSEEAVRILEFATRAPDVNAKTRQNLALAYALAGNWSNARVMAVQDMPVNEANARVAEWMSFVRPEAASSQVASLLGVQPQADAGQPTRLALAPTSAGVAMAQVVAPVPEPVAAAASPMTATEPQPVAVADSTPVFETAAPAAAAPAVTLIQPLPAARARPAVARGVGSPRASGGFRQAMATRAPSDGKFVVQIGAFRTSASAERAWNRISGRVDLANYGAINGSVKSNQASLVRVSVGGFGTRGDANAMCARIKQTGNVCFVRVQAGDAPARWVQRHTFKVAAR